MIKIIRYFVTPSKSNKSKWIVTSVALDDDGKEFNTGRVHGVGSKKWMQELKNQLQKGIIYITPYKPPAKTEKAKK